MSSDRSSAYGPSGIIVLVGLWLIVSPWALGVEPTFQRDVVSVIISGMFIALLAAGNVWGAARSPVLSWIIAALGAWVAAVPFLFGYASDTRWTWSSVISGVIVCALGIVDATTRPRAMADLRRRGLRRDVPGVAFAWDDHPLWALGLAREQPGGARDATGGEFRGVGPRNWRRPDEQILADVCERMTEHPRLDASGVDVIVANGEVTLEGIVGSRAARRLAEGIADTVTGVRDVSNQLRVVDEDGEMRRAA
jgi:hypothetical protein